ncbi:hypothetical protein ACI2K4_19805 [Micromonospora sp. NPDC050397]|uniref:hypothetical protein n=1 Tax=Micromonospora sp. NPDC050397 TaxID=3364279 RepID=UPI00384E2FB7
MNLDRLRNDLADLAEEAAPVDLRDRALRTSRRIGVQRTLASSAAALVMIGAATGTAFAFLPKDNPGPAPGTETPTPAVVTPTPTPTSADASPTPTGTTLKPLTVAEIKNGKLSLSDWGTEECPNGTFSFRNGLHVYRPLPDSSMTFSVVGEPALVDVNGDGVNEAAALIVCSPHAVHAQQVLVFERAPDGGVRSLGRVASVRPLPDVFMPPELIQAVGAGDSGTIRVRWADNQAGSTAAPQWRTYRWTDGQFKQVNGPTRFPDLSADVSVQANPVELKPARGTYEGELKVTVRNAGPKATQALGLTLTLPMGATLTGQSGIKSDACHAVVEGPPQVIACELATLAPSQSVTVSFTLGYAAEATKATGSVEVETSADRKTGNNKVAFTMTVLD